LIQLSLGIFISTYFERIISSYALSVDHVIIMMCLSIHKLLSTLVLSL